MKIVSFFPLKFMDAPVKSPCPEKDVAAKWGWVTDSGIGEESFLTSGEPGELQEEGMTS